MKKIQDLKMWDVFELDGEQYVVILAMPEYVSCQININTGKELKYETLVKAKEVIIVGVMVVHENLERSRSDG